jgi:hypothetical protein
VSPYERVTTALHNVGSRRRGRNWNCPAHDDRHPSLTVMEAADGSGMVLVHCHAGCLFVDICSALGLKPSDLFTNGQASFFPKAKYSPVGIDILRRLPRGPQQSFLVASCIGRFIAKEGRRHTMYSQRQIAGVVVETRHRKAIISELGLTEPQLSNHVRLWTKKWGVAHKCSKTMLTILVRGGASCPMCGSSLGREVQGAPSSQDRGHSVPRSQSTQPRFFKEGVGNYDGLKALEYMKIDD